MKLVREVGREEEIFSSHLRVRECSIKVGLLSLKGKGKSFEGPPSWNSVVTKTPVRRSNKRGVPGQ